LKLEVDGVDGAEVHPLVKGKLAAIVSDREKEEIRPERKRLSAHSEVLQKLMDQTPLLPVAFGIVAGSERELKDLLDGHEEAFLDQLDDVAGNVEMGVRGQLNVDNAFDYYIEAYPELGEKRDELYEDGEPSREDKIELGKLFSEVVEDFQDECAEKAVKL